MNTPPHSIRLEKTKALLSAMLVDAVASGFRAPHSAADKRAFGRFRRKFHSVFGTSNQLPDVGDLSALKSKLEARDLDRTGQRARIRNGKLLATRKETEEAWDELVEVLPDLHALTNLNEVLGRKKNGAWSLHFSTRPLGPIEINLLDARTQTSLSRLRRWLAAVRGNRQPQSEPAPAGEITIGWDTSPAKPRVAITSFKTEHDCWKMRVMGKPVLTLKRFESITSLARAIAQTGPRPHYAVFPELSIPREWLLEVASALHRSQISLITGGEYEINKKFCHNPAYMFLRSTDLGYACLRLVRQDKTFPALDEESELFSLSGLRLRPKRPFDHGFHKGLATRPVIRHGGLHFGVLLCNELTNIDFRQHFRGKVDALFVLEWNRDVKSFNALIESAALDVHCYVVQVNNREYGDSRIRVPAKEEWDRDIVRLQGGIHDYVVLGELDVPALRGFQSRHRSPTNAEARFKPVPTGYKMASERSLNELM
jgi:hypothetical protein